MKQKFFLSIMVICLVATAFAQEKKSVMATMVSIIKARDNAFKDIRANLDTGSSDTTHDNYTTTESFGAATEFITYSKKEVGSVYTSYFSYKIDDELLKANAVVDDVIKGINILAYNGEKALYKAYDYKTDDGKDVTEMVQTDNGFLVMRIISGKNLKGMGFYFYSSTYGKP